MKLDSRGRSALSRACADPDIQLSSISSLLSNCRFGSDASRDKNGKTALHIAIQSQCRVEIIEELVCRRFQKSQRSSCWGNKSMAIMTPDHLGDLPLHMACRNKYRHGVANTMVKLFLDLAPDAAKAENNQGKTPLHIALEHKASTEIIRMLIDACPESVAKKDACDITPLVVAIRNKAESDVFEMLVESDPSITQKRDSRGRYPLHRALELRCSDLKIIKLLCTCPEAVVSEGHSSRGFNALLLGLTQSPVNPEIVEIILHTAPESVRATTGGVNRQTPLEVCYHRYTSTVRNMNSIERHHHTGGGSNFEYRQEVEQWWEVLVMVLKLVTTAAMGEDDSGEWSILGAALSTDAPSRVIQTILDRYPAQVHQQDANGRYPLHMSCMLLGGTSTTSWAESRRQHKKSKDVIVNLILDAGVSAAKKPDNEGRYALHLLTEAGSVSPEIINKLMCANPGAVGELDRKCNLYPFLVVAAAAAGDSNRVDKHDESVDRATVSSIYTLLRERPDLLKSCV